MQIVLQWSSSQEQRVGEVETAEGLGDLCVGGEERGRRGALTARCNSSLCVHYYIYATWYIHSYAPLLYHGIFSLRHYIHYYIHSYILCSLFGTMIHHYPILPCHILSDPILSNPTLSYPILSYPTLSYPILSYTTLHYTYTTPTLHLRLLVLDDVPLVDDQVVPPAAVGELALHVSRLHLRPT